MIKRFVLVVTGLLAATLVLPQTAQPSRTPHTLLWRISGKGVQPSYLFGTMHILCADDAVLGDSLKAVIAHVDEVYFEINLTNLGDMLASFAYMKMRNGKTLSDLLKPGDYERVRKYFASHESAIPFETLQRFKAMLISGLVEGQGLGCETTDGMEMRIMKEMDRQTPKKPINGLETAAFQAGLFDSIPYKKQAKELVDYIDSADQNKKITQQLAGLYRNQDLDGIEALSEKDDPGMEKYMDMLLYNRNRKWARELDTLLPGKSLLIAVGAGHLPGKKGVIELLRKEGYTVEPVFDKN